MTQFVDDYWDNGSLPLWITAQREVKYNLAMLDHFQISIWYYFISKKSFQCHNPMRVDLKHFTFIYVPFFLHINVFAIPES